MTDPDQSNIERPEPAYHSDNNNPQDEDVIERHPDLEATELGEYPGNNLLANPQDPDDVAKTVPGPQLRRAVTTQPRPSDNRLKKFWRHHVRITVYHEDCRDHFALERTFLGWLRTSTALAMLGVTISQLFRLQNNPDAVDDFGFYNAGRPLAALFLVTAIIIILLGSFRFWRLQNAMVRAKVRAAGWELHVLTAVIIGLFITAFALVLRVSDTTPKQPNHQT